jgi:hypothetical protein
MRAVVFKAIREVTVEDVPAARVERDDDVVVVPGHLQCAVRH